MEVSEETQRDEHEFKGSNDLQIQIWAVS